MSEQNPEQVLNNILKNFQRYSRDGETLTVIGEEVQYDYVRSCQDPSYVGTYHDRVTFKKSELMRLIDLATSSGVNTASITTDILKEEFDDLENLDTGGRLGNTPPYTTKRTLELRIVKDIPVLRTGDMLPWDYLRIK